MRHCLLIAIVLSIISAQATEITSAACNDMTTPLKATFTPAPRGCGTVNPRAVVAILVLGSIKVSAALDSRKPQSSTFDCLRLDFTGKNHFNTARILDIGKNSTTTTGNDAMLAVSGVIPHVKLNGKFTDVAIDAHCRLMKGVPREMTFRAGTTHPRDKQTVSPGKRPIAPNATVTPSAKPASTAQVFYPLIDVSQQDRDVTFSFAGVRDQHGAVSQTGIGNIHFSVIGADGKVIYTATLEPG